MLEDQERLYPKTWREQLEERMRAQGWHLMGREGLTKTKFVDGRFLEVPDQTEDNIRKKYLDVAKKNAPNVEFEVDLILDEDTEKLQRLRRFSTEDEFRALMNNLSDEDKVHLVFMRKVEK